MEANYNRDYLHQPVLLKEVLSGLNLKPGGIYVDCTVGTGGHSLEILRSCGYEARLVGFDQDIYALDIAKQRLSFYKKQIILVQENYVNLAQVLKKLGISETDGILFDLGVSSLQLDDPQRGFSYQYEGPLDMRMNPDKLVTAANLVNKLSEKELATIISRFSEERWARRVAAFIVQERKRQPIETTTQLVEVIKKAIPASARRTGKHPAKRTFQALRIALNNELENLAQVLPEAVNLLKPGGRLCVISYHSLEDRLVKNTFKDLAASCKCPPEFPLCVCNMSALIKQITPQPIVPSPEEIFRNPRSRSARLRIAEKLSPVLKRKEEA
ncbi:MAG: 16S rRNA (cytosine(1402)-N(4))-methyltransferase RsmH [Peptococcaceae bacterium]